MADHVKNPFVDFKFGANYASDFHLLRTSASSRYNDNLIPTLTDKTAEVPGGDGMYFFSTQHKQRQFTVNVAFDNVTESDLSNIRQWLNGKEIKDLIFDERDTVAYKAKVTGTPAFKYIAFDEAETKGTSSNTHPTRKVDDSNTKIIRYKGEGTITFTCFYPYGLSTTAYHAGTAVAGEAPTTFTVSVTGTISSGGKITIGGISPNYIVTFGETVTNPSWDSATGMVKGTAGGVVRPVKVKGNVLGTLDVGITPTVTSTSGSATLTYYNRFL